jgi:chorismate mutase
MKELEAYRKQIDELDIQLIDCISRRFEIVRAVGRLKAEHSMEIVQSKRAEQVVKKAMGMAKEKNVDPELIRNFYLAMIDVAHIIEHKILEDHERAERA